MIDPELGADIVSLGMVPSIDVADDGVVTVEVKLTISGCPMRAEIKREVEDRVERHPGVADVKITWGEMTPEERSEVIGQGPLERPRDASPTKIPPSTKVLAISSGKGGVGKSSVTVNLAAALAAHVIGSACSTPTSGASRCPACSVSTPAWRPSGSRGTTSRSSSPTSGPCPASTAGPRRARSGVDRVPRRRRHRPHVARLMLTKAVEQFLNDVRWGDLDYLLIDMPPGTGDVQMGLARMLPATDLIVVTTPALAAQKVAQRAPTWPAVRS